MHFLRLATAFSSFSYSKISFTFVCLLSHTAKWLLCRCLSSFPLSESSLSVEEEYVLLAGGEGDERIT